MLEYILNIIRGSNFKSPLHNALYNILNDYQYRRHISYNANSDKFEILVLKENERDGQTISGNTKHWHSFLIKARKK